MARTREKFLEDCASEDREAYESLFADIEELGTALGDPEPTDGSALAKPLEGLPLRLRIAFDDKKGAALELQHANLAAQAPLLWFFPTNNTDSAAAVNRVSALLSQVEKAGVKPEDVTAFGTALKGADFVSGGSKSLKTSTAGEATGISRIFRWDGNRAKVVRAIRTLVERVSLYAK